ncbi:hypothetical protein [Streptomyces canus]|uniref:hypothetical protein n=1 Tax=Streptomyces canus TaxID=58343 RepID=UPI0022598B17|nr:hypothetical protein [Streptomyces canus]MCX4854992.1 hypothetical protein [Streptomyces canus]
MNRHVKTASILLAAVTAALMTGCSASSTNTSNKAEDPRTEPIAQESSTVDKANWPPATPRSGLAKGLSLPLEDYMQTYQDTVSLDNAARHIQKQCMADYGLTITLPPAGSTPPPNDNDANIERRYGITDRATAEKYGYGLPDDLQHQQGATLPKMTKEEAEVFSGYTSLNLHDPNRAPAPSTYKGKKIHKNGCAGWADDQLGTRSLDFSLVSELDGQSLTQSQNTPAVQNAITAWSTCMSAKGYTVDTPYNADKIVSHTDGNPSQDEIDVALADIDCKKSTDLVQIWFDAETAIQKQQIADHRDGLTKPKARNTAALAAAKTALAG